MDSISQVGLQLRNPQLALLPACTGNKCVQVH